MYAFRGIACILSPESWVRDLRDWQNTKQSQRVPHAIITLDRLAIFHSLFDHAPEQTLTLFFTTVHLQCAHDIRDWHCWVWHQTFLFFTDKKVNRQVNQTRKKNTVQSTSRQGSNLGLPIAGHTLWPLMEWSRLGRIFNFWVCLTFEALPRKFGLRLFCQISFPSGHSLTGALIMKTQHRGNIVYYDCGEVSALL